MMLEAIFSCYGMDLSLKFHIREPITTTYVPKPTHVTL